MKKNILILFGGMSCEHDISIVSTYQVLKSFDEYLYDLTLVYIDKKGIWKLVEKNTSIEKFKSARDKLKHVQLGVNENVLYVKHRNKYKPYCNIDVAFPILHGVNGEDGCVMGLLKMSNIPFVGCDNISSSIGIDKSLFKNVCCDLPVLPSTVVMEDSFDVEKVVDRVSKEIGFPCIIKPSRLGSSIGINICKNEENLINLIKNTLNFDNRVLLEPFIENLREFNIALYKVDGKLVLSEIEEPILQHEMLSFEDKYLTFSEQPTAKNIPANVNSKLRNQIIENAKKVYTLLNCSGVVRVDFIYDKLSKKLYINEINTIPGSLALYLFEAGGVERKQVINQLIHESVRKFNADNDVKTNYNSSVLDKQDFSKFNML